MFLLGLSDRVMLYEAIESVCGFEKEVVEREGRIDFFVA